ncbi:Solute carrier family 22 member 21, partial [Operophtera brumata]
LNLACHPWHSNLIGTIHSTGMLLSMIRSQANFDILRGGKLYWPDQDLGDLIHHVRDCRVPGSCMLEICGIKNRILSGVVFAYSIYLGECIFACIAIFVPYWKTLIHIINGPSIFFITYIFLIRESPRWEILNGKIEKAKKTLLVMTDMNETNINRQELAEIDEAKLKDKFNIVIYEKQEGLKDVVTSKVIMKRLLVAAICRFTSSFVYYGLMINSVYLPGSKYTNFLLATVMSFPGELVSLYLMNKIGRKMPLMVGYITCGVLCIASGFVPETCFTGALTYTMELFPTSTRGSLLGMGAFASR